MDGFFDLYKNLNFWSESSTTDQGSTSQSSNENQSLSSELKSIAYQLYSTISETSNKIIKTVENNPIFCEFNKEQQNFLNSNKRSVSKGFPPWLGCPNEEAIKEECLSLSNDTRTFMRNPPAGIDFKFDYDALFPTALAIMDHDSNLVKMRYNLVPKLVKEESFWRNYFYRVSLICRANDLLTLTLQKPSSEIELFDRIKQVSVKSDNELQSKKEDEKQQMPDSLEESWEKELESELHDYAVMAGNENCIVGDDYTNDVDEEERML